MRVLGVDPGTYAMGVGIVDYEDGALRLVHSETLCPARSKPVPGRLLELYESLVRIITRWRPEEVAVEEPFIASNRYSAIAVGQAQAVAFMAAAHGGLTVWTYPPRRVKQAVTDNGASSKQQVQEMVKVLLAMPSLPASFDAADALAVAICHANASRLRELVVLE